MLDTIEDTYEQRTSPNNMIINSGKINIVSYQDSNDEVGKRSRIKLRKKKSAAFKSQASQKSLKAMK